MDRLTGHILAALYAVLAVAGCRQAPAAGDGVPYELARFRAETVSDVEYSLRFEIPEAAGEAILAEERIDFNLAGRCDVILDFKAPGQSLLSLSANGREIDSEIIHEHIRIPAGCLKKGANSLGVEFIAGSGSVNRRNGFLYTLLVSDRARTLFPCFDQPDMKAAYRLELTVPAEWTAISNTQIENESVDGPAKTVSFARTEPLSTYLFSFVAGRFERRSAERGGRSISMYYRETDPDKVAQCPEILSQVFDDIEWMEDWTGVPYPFAKYDFIVLPDFQYGGMEHTGATLYNDRRIFLEKSATTDERRSRATLLAHETAHMWFGDYVTMEWFNDVWLKEVFANWFASKMTRPMFPDVDYALSDLKDYFIPAYDEDRTEGAAPIQQPLGNLQDAGLIYSNIVYDKSPIVMNYLVELMGEEAFQAGMREYLAEYAYSDAVWDDLVEILDRHTPEDLQAWSEKWVKEAGMPIYEEPDASEMEGSFWVPNLSGHGYGAYLPGEESLQHIMDTWGGRDAAARESLLITLYENSIRGRLEKERFVAWAAQALEGEGDPLVYSSLHSFARHEALLCSEVPQAFEEALLKEMKNGTRSPEMRISAFRSLVSVTRSASTREALYRMWEGMKAPAGLPVGERDWTDLSYSLMIFFPERYESIVETQRLRISDPDRLETFLYVSRAASPDGGVRKAMFEEMMACAENRKPESRVLAALSLLCNVERVEESKDYIVPTLEHLCEIQRTSDIFFPASWCRTLLRCHQGDAEVAGLVRDWLDSHPEMSPLLKSKVLIALGVKVS